MKYVQPYGETDVDAPYINGDPSIGRMGSIPPAAAFEHPMRELVHVITDSKLTPNEGDLEQVAKGVRSQRMNYVEDSGAVNNLSVALDPPLGSYSIGLPLRVKVYQTNTGPASIDAGAGRVGIRKPTGAEVDAGDLPAGGLVELVYDGASFQMINFGGAGAGGADNTFLVNVPYTVDTGTPNNVVANFSPALPAPVAGSLVMVKIAHTNTGFATLNINGTGARPIFAQGGTAAYPLLASDLRVGDVLLFTYDGTQWWVYANTILDQAITVNLSNNTQINQFFEALGRKRILTSGYVTVKLAAGVYGPINTYHSNADRITVAGTMLAAAPDHNSFSKTGNSPASRAFDSSQNLGMLRSRFGTEVRFTNAGLVAGLSHTGPGNMTFHSILVTGENVPQAAGQLPVAGVASFTSTITCRNVTVWGSGKDGFTCGAGTMGCEGCFASGCWDNGFLAHTGSTMTLNNCGSYGNNANGCYAAGNSIIGTYPGVYTEFVYNGWGGIVSQVFSLVGADNWGLFGNAVVDLYAHYMSTVYMQSPRIYSTTSPAPNTVGNINSVVIIA